MRAFQNLGVDAAAFPEKSLMLPQLSSYTPQWPQRLVALLEAVHSPAEAPTWGPHATGPHATGPRTSAPRTEAWLLVHAALGRFARAHARRMPWVAAEDIEDLVAQKTLDLLARAERGEWNVNRRLPGEVVNYLSMVARNGLVDRYGERARLVAIDAPENDAVTHTAPAADAPDSGAASNQFADHLRECAAQLPSRSRRAWFLRVFLDLSSRDIADQPDIHLDPAHVDVVLQRARDAVRRCMTAKGHDTSELPPGVFVALWRAFRVAEES
jgi:RNA polymerase sigma factor (sigma-70 family)